MACQGCPLDTIFNKTLGLCQYCPSGYHLDSASSTCIRDETC